MSFTKMNRTGSRRVPSVTRLVALALVVAGTAAACGPDPSAPAALERASAEAAAPPDPASVTGVEGATPAPAAPTPTVAPTIAEPAPTTSGPPRSVVSTGYAPFATVGGIVLHHPAGAVETVGFHESNHDGARMLDPLPGVASPIVLESRERGTGARTAADIVADPASEIRVPVTGVVKRSGGYTLYCDHRDHYLVIAPDAQPSWEVKLLHVEGMAVKPGQRVVAGETVVAPRARTLPFESQVDEVTANPSWPHVHVEVVDPSIPDRPSPGGGCP